MDLGPEGGDGGGTIIACGTPEEVAKRNVVIRGNIFAQLLTKFNYELNYG